MNDPYSFPRKYRSCLNCIHLDQPESNISGSIVGGCRKRLISFGVRPDNLKKTYCGQWFLKQLSDNEY